MDKQDDKDKVVKPLTGDQLQAIATKVTNKLHRIGKLWVEIGRDLLAAKARMPHGQFERLFRDYDGPDPVKDPIPMAHYTGTTYMRIAAHPVLSKGVLEPHLPHNLNALVALVRAPEKQHDKIERGLKEGRIAPTTSVTEVRDFLRGRAKLQIIPDREKAMGEIKKKLTAMFEQYPTLRDYMREVFADLYEQYPNQPERPASETPRRLASVGRELVDLDDPDRPAGDDSDEAS